MSCDRTSTELFPWIARLALLAVLILNSDALAVAQDPAIALESTLVKLIEQSEPAVVSIARIRPPAIDPRSIVIKPLERVPFAPTEAPPADPEDPNFQPNAFGAGVLIAGSRPGEKVVLTNYHVVKGGPVYSAQNEHGSKLFVRFSDRRSCFASILAADPRSDMAVLHLDLAESKIEPAELKTLDWTTATPTRWPTMVRPVPVGE
jgi:S1-C subfamily serine protease